MDERTPDQTIADQPTAEPDLADWADPSPAGYPVFDPADEPITAEAEALVHALQELWLAPREHECLPCYLDRTVEQIGCAGDLRLAARYRDLLAPRATALERRLQGSGGYCDCEVLMNAVQPAWHLWQPERWTPTEAGTAAISAPQPPTQMPPCTGVRRGSTRPCRNWHSMVRPRW